MNILLIEASVFGLLSLIFFILYMKTKKKYNKTNDKLKEVQESYKGTLALIRDELTTKRFGYYKTTINILSDNDKKNNTSGDAYDVIIHVNELDRYTNGMSKIEIKNMENISGLDIYQYEYVKKCTRSNFQSVKKTSDIEWLESEESLKEIRKQKLEKIINSEKKL